MKSRLFTVLAVAASLLVASSCSILNQQTFGRPQYINVKIAHTLDRYSALAVRKGQIIKLMSNQEIYYDGLRVSGTFCLVDNFTYESTPGEYVTVPVYMRIGEYNNVYK